MAEKGGMQWRDAKCERGAPSSDGVQLMFRNLPCEIRNMRDILWGKVTALIASAETSVGIIRTGA